jgi:hypothetical protein
LQRKNMMAANIGILAAVRIDLVGTTADFADLAHAFRCRSITCSVKIAKRRVESAKTG